jgi:ERCC4-type nuclease
MNKIIRCNTRNTRILHSKLNFRGLNTSQRAKQPLALEPTTTHASPWIFGPVNPGKLETVKHDFGGLLTVDHREPIQIKTALENRGAVISTLPFGDFGLWKHSQQGKHQHPTLSDVELRLVVERKEIKDFARSVVDGRLANQLSQLQESGVPHCHVVEGPFHSSIFKETGSFLGVPESRFLDALVELTMEHGCRVMHTMDSSQTMHLLELLAKRVQDDLIQKLTVKKKPLVKKSKTVLRVPSGVDGGFVSTLTAIKGISLERAITIATVFPTQAQLFKFMEMHGEGALITLRSGDCTIQDPPPKKITRIEGDARRNFGKAVSNNLYKHFFGSSAE